MALSLLDSERNCSPMSSALPCSSSLESLELKTGKTPGFEKKLPGREYARGNLWCLGQHQPEIKKLYSI